MDATNFVLCGLGGQGILFMTKILAQASLDKGYNIMGAETHGMAQRGGSVVSHLRIGDVKNSLVETGAAHFLLALDENEGYRNLPFLSPGAGMYVNAGKGKFPRNNVKKILDKYKVSYHAIAAGVMAQDLGAPMSTNLALLGFFAAFEQGPVKKDELRNTIESISPERFRETNLKVFDAGVEKGAKAK